MKQAACRVLFTVLLASAIPNFHFEKYIRRLEIRMRKIGALIEGIGR